MADASSAPAPTPAAPPTTPAASPSDVYLAFLRHNLGLVVRSVTHLEPRFLARVLRTLPTTRRKAQELPAVLATAIDEGTAKESPIRAELLAFLPQPYVPKAPAAAAAAPAAGESMDVDDDAAAAKKTSDKEASAAPPAPQSQPFKPAPEASPELEAYLRLVVVVWLIDAGHLDKALFLSRASLTSMINANRRTLDLLGAKTVFYLARAAELTKAKKNGGSTAAKEQAELGGLAEERSFLLSLHRTSSLRHDPETQATVINLLLRSYIVDSNLYEQADKLVSRAPFPRSSASNGQIARYEYYVGRIRAVQLNYTEAHGRLQQAIRRAPQSHLAGAGGAKKDAKANDTAETTKAATATTATTAATAATAAEATKPPVPAAGFLQTAHKFLVVVELLMGDIPERSIFRNDVLKRALAPYMEIVQAVRVGDLSLFQKTLSEHQSLFLADKTHSLILRLRHNVIKTGIRTISLAYSRISLADVTRKLHLESEEDAEYIVAKAIRDGVIEGQVDHTRGEMRSRETGDVYLTNEPQAQFKTRIGFCLQLHNESVKAMRYPLNNHRAELASAVEARERERELANEIADGDISDDDEDWV